VRRRQGILLLCSVSVVMAATVLAGTSSQFKDAATGHTGAAGAGGTAGEPNAVEAYAGTDETPGRLHSVRRQLQSLNISSIARRQDPNSTRRLHDYIEYLNSLRLPQPKPAPTGTETSEPSPGNAGETTVNSQPVSGGTAQSEPNLPAEQGGNDELDRAIAAILERPDEIAHPLEAAQMLYVSGNTHHAGLLYRLALERMAGRTTQPDRPWALFQLANCLRLENDTEAEKIYQQVISEFPNSPWAAAADVQCQLIEWRRTSNLETLLEEKYPGDTSNDPNSL